MLMNVTYRRDDGALVKSIAVYSYRCGPIGRWMVGDVPLDDIRSQVVSQEILPPPPKGGE